MTTVINPSGTTVAVFNRSGAVIVSLTGSGVPGGGGVPPASPTPVPSVAQKNIVLLAVAYNNFCFQLADCDIGDEFEFHLIDPPGNAATSELSTAPQNARVFMPSGHTFAGGGNSFFGVEGTGTSWTYGGYAVRKIGATAWVPLWVTTNT